MFAGGGVGWIKAARTAAPHHRSWQPLLFVDQDHFIEVCCGLQTENDHEGFVEFRVSLGGGAFRRLGKIQIETEKERQENAKHRRHNPWGHRKPKPNTKMTLNLNINFADGGGVSNSLRGSTVEEVEAWMVEAYSSIGSKFQPETQHDLKVEGVKEEVELEEEEYNHYFKDEGDDDDDDGEDPDPHHLEENTTNQFVR